MTQFFSCIKSALAVTMLCGAATAMAAETYDLGVLEPGVEYEFPGMTDVIGEYTPTQSGLVRFLYTRADLLLYTSPAHEDNSLVASDFNYVEGKKLRSYPDLVEGQTYYLYGYPMDHGTLMITEGSTELEVTSISPTLKEDEYFSVSSNYTVEMAFNTPVTATNALLIVGEEKTPVNYMVSGVYVTVDVANAIMDMYHNGTLRKGDEVTIRLVGVADFFDKNNKYGGNGKLETTFVVDGKPGELVKVVNADLNNAGNPFLSYYAPGNPAGIISFEFDAPLAADGSSANISYGNPDNAEVGVYVEQIPGVNEGNTASFDFCGKLRRPIDMLPLSTAETQPSELFIAFANIFTEDGQRIYTGKESNPSSIPVSFRIVTLQYNLASDFMPGRGSALSAGDDMEIWVMNGKYLTASGIEFKYTENGDAATLVVPMAEVNAEEDPTNNDDMVYTFKVPEINVDVDSSVVVTFADAICADGLDHSAELTGEFGYNTTAVETIGSAEAETVTVYNAAGICVLRNAGRDALATLPAGLYIVNGKKLIL